MANIESFSVQSPYDRQMEELKRRQRMAELMQQEAMQPLESQVAPGGMVVPTSPVLGLAKLLQGYMSGKQLRDIEKQRGEAEQGARTEALDFLRSFSPERKTIGMGEAFGAGLPIPQISDKGQVSYQAPSVTAMPNARLVGSLDQPMQMQVGGPLGRRDQLARAEEGMFSSNPLVRALAQTKYEAASRPVNLMDYMDKPKLDTATPESVRAYTESIAQGAPDPSVLRYTTKPQPVSQATVMRNGRKVVIDANTGREIGQAPAEYHAPEKLEAIIGDDGKIIYVKASEAVGKTPYYPSSAEKPKSVPPSEIGKMEQNFVSIKKLDQTLDQLEKNPESIGLKFGASQKLNDRLDPKGIDLRAGIADIGSLVLHDRSGAAITASESPRLMPFIPTVTDTAEAAKKKLQRFKQEYMNVLNEQNLDYSPDYGWSRPSILDRYLKYTRGSRKTINGVTYENRGKGPNDWHKVEEQ